MLQSLNIINFAIIDDTLLEFEEGVVVFTGETGAGKSIIFDALAVLLGRRASVNMIRSGAEFFRVEGIFSMTEKLEEVLKSLDIDIDENQLIISRKMNTKGRGTCMINGSLCTLKQIQSIGNELLILHEQNDNEMLLSANSCQIMIDESSKEIRDLYKNYRKEYTSWYNLRKQLLEFETKKQEHERRLDILQWEINRIKEAEIKKEEDEYIDKQIKILSNQEKIREKIVDSISLIHAENGVIELLSKVLRNLNSISMYDQELNEVIESIQSAYYTIDDRGSFLESYQNIRMIVIHTIPRLKSFQQFGRYLIILHERRINRRRTDDGSQAFMPFHIPPHPNKLRSAKITGRYTDPHTRTGSRNSS